ncbi:bifunctional ornithine acetyltransferase/N-acetylglutamate synthase [Salirhabdus salicampi]|uniref:bifunctional ornithine acetyltransferase/N-acetylglutamate synthase n=1 Tax=Salirhabdus salicampi TaxID=476102 RepID=UPI0020C2E491|nr:bifunctional ornithine acetyltransferase/N-acetylglutamate synthase [Salirhabdus salicampi]MCP8617318.1 bifunctional ornithine acetyltransferase/N-acetylglutamate synthase [Salirhabdus salicampi]
MSVNKGEVKRETAYTVLEDGNVATPVGYKAGGLHCGIKRKRPDLGWLYSKVPATAAGVYTTNTFQAPPLVVTQESIEAGGKIQGVIVNSGNANACTGTQGLTDAYNMRKMFSDHFHLLHHETAVVSTGVIGEPMPMEKIKTGISNLSMENHEVEQFERAILTTDTCTKHVGVKMEIDGKMVTIGGSAKGSGMIHPNMATMLAFITTDANIKKDDLDQALKTITDKTFNCISVDGDSSTNDMVLLLANGMVENDTLHANHPDWSTFVAGLTYVCETLAKQIARDGEGATKLIEVQVDGASSHSSATAIAKSIISSNLVKTAVFGEDPNWGRIIGAIGYSGEQVDPNSIEISLGPIKVISDGLPTTFNEEEAIRYLQNEFIQIYVSLHAGEGTGKAWGCDLTYEYVRINASYRT